MFARHITHELKRNMWKEYSIAFEMEIMPLLRKQRGFLDELLLVAPEKQEVVAISLWESKEDAETYNRGVYPQIEKILNRYSEGLPVVKTYNAEYSTFRKPAVAVAV